MPVQNSDILPRLNIPDLNCVMPGSRRNQFAIGAKRNTGDTVILITEGGNGFACLNFPYVYRPGDRNQTPNLPRRLGDYRQ
jgi:hypothetical protein